MPGKERHQKKGVAGVTGKGEHVRRTSTSAYTAPLEAVARLRPAPVTAAPEKEQFNAFGNGRR
jgi:hypothetical protein